jgi:hypothetical protein
VAQIGGSTPMIAEGGAADNPSMPGPGAAHDLL